MDNAENMRREAFEAGLRLLGNHVRFRHWPAGTGVLCTKVTKNSMVEIEGFSGEFAPYLFEIDGEVAAVPFLGRVN